MTSMRSQRGISLVELLVGVVVGSLIVAGAISYYVVEKRLLLEEDLTRSTNANLRSGMQRLQYALRNAGFGQPEDLTNWIPWVSGFTTAAVNVTDGGGTNPDTISIAMTTSKSVATLGAAVTTLATSITVDDASAFDVASNKRFILIGLDVPAHVTAVSGTTLTIDAGPGLDGNQGLCPGEWVDCSGTPACVDPPNPLPEGKTACGDYAVAGGSDLFPSGTPIWRVDVQTFDVDTVNNRLRLNRNDGSGAEALLDDITDLQAETVTAGKQYKITLSTQSERINPSTGTFVTRSFSSDVATIY